MQNMGGSIGQPLQLCNVVEKNKVVGPLVASPTRLKLALLSRKDSIMIKYDVVWNIELEADSPGEAAQIAREIQLDPDSMATVFEVIDEEDQIYTVDVEDLIEAPAEEEVEDGKG